MNRMEQAMCRTCLAQTDGSIFKTVFLDQTELLLVEMLNECTGIKVIDSDGLSLKICDICTEEIIKSYVYRKKCWESHKFLLQRLEANNSEIDPIKCELISDSEMLDEVIRLVSDTEEGEPDDSISKKTESTVHYVNLNETSKGNGPLKCQLCDKIYSRKDVMLEHLRVVHNILDYHKFDCKNCTKAFRQSSALRRHIASIHEQPDGEEATKFMCHHCGLKLKNRQNFIEHVRRHTGEKPYKCNLCEYRAAQRRSMVLHKRKHTDERPYECDICGKAFRTSSSRSYHRKGHSDETPYECIVCLKKFKKKDIYKEHMIIHDPDKYIDCKYCGKKFARKDNLKTHIKQHTGEKAHVCEFCGKGFIQKHCWRNHMINHHNE